MKKVTVALLSGGVSTERNVSLKSGDQVFNALDKDKYDIVRYDPKYDLGRLVHDADKIDVAFIVLHGPFGEDGTIQGLLDLLNIPYQGSGVLGSALSMNKLAAKKAYEQAGIPVAPYIHVKRGTDYDAKRWFEALGVPLVIKPVSGGSSIGMSFVKSEDELEQALDDGFGCDSSLLIEKYISGIEVTGGVIGNDELSALPLVEIIPDEKYDFFDYTAKYTAGETLEICPARIDDVFTRRVQEYSTLAHNVLFCRGYSRSDFIIHQDAVYILETNTIPGMTETSLLPIAAKAAGMSFHRLLDKLIALSLE